MIRAKHTQTISEFLSNYAEVLNRLNQSGEAEFLTQGGEAKAVLLSPKVFDELRREAELAKQASLIRQSIAMYERGEYRDGFQALEDIKRKLHAS